MDVLDLIYDWNRAPHPRASRGARPRVVLNDETLRDGLQSPSVTDPEPAEKIALLHLMDALGIGAADIGLPGAGARAKSDALLLAREIAHAGLRIAPNCAARTMIRDIEPIVEISERAGIPVEAATFIGSSPIRQYAEGWDIDRLLRHTEEAVTYAVGKGLPVMYVTEDTTRAAPETIRRLYTTAIECGARRVCLSDTVGHATPGGARNLVAFVREVVADTGEEVAIDWHGHRDRGLAVANAIAAHEAGAQRLHATAIGIGERVGNTEMDLLLANLRLMGLIDNDLTRLPEYCDLAARACGVPIPCNYPVVGSDAFRTGTGVHAAAIVKAERKGDKALADYVYSGIPAHIVGRTQIIEIGPMSGESNVVHWLGLRGVDAAPELVARILSAAKSSKRTLTTEEIERLLAP
jgi:2-isopropylmalate synthase